MNHTSTQTTTTRRTADIAYAEHAQTVQRKIDQLQRTLKDFDSKQKANPKNWGYAGSLEHLSNELSEIISQFN